MHMQGLPFIINFKRTLELSFHSIKGSREQIKAPLQEMNLQKAILNLKIWKLWKQWKAFALCAKAAHSFS